MAEEVLAGFSHLQESPPSPWGSPCASDKGTSEDCSLPAWTFLQAQISAEIPFASHQSLASTTCRMRLQGKQQQGMAPETAGQQGSGQETAPTSDTGCRENLSQRRWEAALPSAGSEQGQHSVPLWPQECPWVTPQGRCLWLVLVPSPCPSLPASTC